MEFIKRKTAALRTKDEITHLPESNSSDEKHGETTTATATGMDENEKPTFGVERTDSAAIGALSAFKDEHILDPNLPIDELNEMDQGLAEGNAEKGVEIERALLEENSPYPEVRATVRNYDESLPASTIRAWFIGMLLTTLGAGINCLFSLRNPSIALTTYAIQLIAYPLGLGWDLIMPDRVWTFLPWGLTFNLRPGKFNFKEHTIIVVMANASYAGGAIYATDTILAQVVFYGQNFGWAFQLLFAVSNQMLGYGLAGVCRRWLVWPAAMIWPSNLVNCALMYTLHDHSPSDPAKTNGWSIGRYRWFLYVMCGAFVWYFFPGWIFQGLSYFTFACWIAPKNVVVNQVFGGLTGLGLIPITFDWTVITGYTSSPLIPPWYAIMNTLIGLFIFFIFTALGIHFSGGLYADYFPMQDSRSYDNTGHRYNVSRILDSNYQFNEELYKSYSPIFLSTGFALCYGISFAGIMSVIVHTALYHSKTIWRQWKQARDQEDDVHMKLMKKYRDAPDWWYAVLFVVMLALSYVTILAWTTHFTWWAFIICILIPIFFMVPVGMIYATTNIQIGLNVITEFIIGYMTPGRPLAMMLFKSYGYITMVQAQYFLADLKLGHYLKVPPRAMFWAQMVATLWSSVVQIAVLNWALGNVPNICDGDVEGNVWTCPGGNVFFTASVIWGAIGPARIFSPGAIYDKLLWFFLIGFLLPIATFLLARKWPRSFFRYLSVPVMFGGIGSIPPATAYNYLSWGFVGWFFNKYIKSRYNGWWSQYNYITSAALDCGLILCTLLIFFTLVLTNATAPQWYGNVAVFETLDQTDKAVRKHIPKGQTIGPKTWA